MKNFNAPQKPENPSCNKDQKATQEFACDLLRTVSSDANLSETSCAAKGQPEKTENTPVEFVDFQAFDRWMDQELDTLENRFRHNMTVDSMLHELKRDR